MSRAALNGTAVLDYPALSRAERSDLFHRSMRGAKGGLVAVAVAAAGAVGAQAVLMLLAVGAPIVAGVILWRASRAA